MTSLKLKDDYVIEFGEDLEESIEKLKCDGSGKYKISGTVYVSKESTGYVGMMIIRGFYVQGYWTINKYLKGATRLEDSMEFHMLESKIDDRILFSNLLEVMIEANFLL